MAAYLLNFPGFFYLFWPISIVLLFEYFDSSSNFQLCQCSFQTFGDRSKCTNYIWYHRHLHVPHHSLFFSKVQLLVSLFASLIVGREGKVNNTASSLFLVNYYQAWSSGWHGVICLYHKVLENFVTHFPGLILV